LTHPPTSLNLSLLFTLLICISSVRADEVRANRSETRTQGQTSSRTYGGDVVATFKQSRISADSAFVASDSDHYTFYQSVRFQDGHHVVFADQASYDAANAVAVLSGNVHLSGANRSLSAGSVTYRIDAQQIEASDQVTIGFSEHTKLRTDHWLQDVSADTAIGWGMVSFLKLEPDSLTVLSERVFVRNDGERLVFVQDARFLKGKWGAKADSATYLRKDETVHLVENVRLSGNPGNASGSDSLSASATEAEIRLREGKIVGMTLLDEARFNIVRSDSSGETASSIQSDTVFVVFENEDISEIQVDGNVDIQIVTADSGRSRLEGDSSRIRFDHGQPSQIHIKGMGKLILGADGDSLNADISGYGLTIDLMSAAIQSVRVDSVAVYEIKGDHPTRLSGKHLRLLFDHKKLTRAEVDGDVQGQYQSSGAKE